MLQLDISNQGVYIMSKVPVYTQRAQQAYRDSTLSVQFTANPRTEPELYDILKDMPKRATYIKELIKKDKGIK